MAGGKKPGKPPTKKAAPPHAFKKGQSGNPNGRPPGSKNKSTMDFKEAVTKLINNRGDELEEWLMRVAQTNPARALDCVNNLAEYAVPKQSRVTIAGDINEPVLFKQLVDDVPLPPTNKTDN